MDELLKGHLDNELSGSAHEALNAAVQAIYFDDRSDYKTALWEVVTSLCEGLIPEDSDDKFIKELFHYLNPNWA